MSWYYISELKMRLEQIRILAILSPFLADSIVVIFSVGREMNPGEKSARMVLKGGCDRKSGLGEFKQSYSS